MYIFPYTVQLSYVTNCFAMTCGGGGGNLFPVIDILTCIFVSGDKLLLTHADFVNFNYKWSYINFCEFDLYSLNRHEYPVSTPWLGLSNFGLKLNLIARCKNHQSNGGIIYLIWWYCSNVKKLDIPHDMPEE